METRVYVVEAYDLDYYFLCELLKDQDAFIVESERQGKVYSIEGFELDYNEGNIDAHSYIRIITK